VQAVCFDLSQYGSVPEIAGVDRVGLIGDLVELKNHLLAIELTERLRDRGEKVSLLMVGRDMSDNVPRTKTYSKRVREITAATPGVELTSSTPEAMPDVIARFELLLHISTVPESFGRVCVEAMAAGRPVVAYDHGGVSELIDHARTGLLCPPGDVESVERALHELLQDRGRSTQMGRTARVVTLDRFDQRPDRRDTVGDALAEFAIENR
jgi:glycosyltransferase involved in cell wall biosynthesis